MTSQEFRDQASTYRSLAAAGGGVAQVGIGNKSTRFWSPKDLLDAADRLDAIADRMDGVRRTFYGNTVAVFRRG